MIRIDFEDIFRTLLFSKDKLSLPTPPIESICQNYKTDMKSTALAFDLMSHIISINSDFPEILVGDDVYKDGEKVFDERVKYIKTLSSNTTFNNPCFMAMLNANISILKPLFKDARLSKINPNTGKTFWGELAMAVTNNKRVSNLSTMLPGYDFVWREDENGDAILTYEKIA